MKKLDKWISKTISSPQPQQKKTVSTNKKIKFKTRKPQQKTQRTQTAPINHRNKLRIIAMGGLNEVGKNCTAFEYYNDIVVVDAGLQFPEEDMLGVDFVIPDMSYLEKNQSKIRALIVTHGHLDHIGAIPHFLKKFPHVPVIATKLTIGLIQKRLDEFKMKANLRIINPEKDNFQFGNIKTSFFRVNHSVPDGMGVFLETPAGNAVHTGDFKIDFRPADGIKMDMGHLAKISNKGVDVLLADSTNANKKGYCLSEHVIAKNLEQVIDNAKGRLIIASFSSLIGRLQQIINFAVKNGRKVFVSGRSMEQNLELAAKNGYLKIPRGSIRKLSPKIQDELPAHKILILTTGSQGETMSALSRISLGEHRQIKVHKGDTVVFSSSPIPGNERSTTNVINNLYRLGAHVITNDAVDIHTSGHAHQEDLKIMQSILHPKHTVPIHGEFYMRMAHREMLINEYGLNENQVHIMENGSILEVDKDRVRRSKEKVPSDIIIIDGVGVGDTGTQVIRERQTMSKNGVVVILFRAFDKSKRLIADPDIISRGFIYIKESQQIAKAAQIEARQVYENTIRKNPQIKIKDLKMEIMRRMRSFIIKKLSREPMILPIIVFC